MDDNKCYCQSLYFDNDTAHFESELCIASSDLKTLEGEARAFLHEREMVFYQNLTYENRRLSYLLGHFAAKNAIVRHQQGLSLNDVLIGYGFFQNPIIYLPEDQKVRVSYSHSNVDSAAVTFDESFPMGIDIEAMQSKIIGLADFFMSDEDKFLLSKQNYLSEMQSHTMLWTIKEAISKALCTGMTAPLTIYALKEIQNYNQYWVSEFKNFSQYRAISFLLGQSVCSIVYPKLVDIKIDIDSIQKWYNGYQS